MADHRAALLAVCLAAVHEEVEAARRIELVVAEHALAEPRDVLLSFGFDHHVDPLVAMVVTDAHRAGREDAIVDDVHLRVFCSACACARRGCFCARPRAECVRLLLEAAGRAIHRAEEPRLKATDRIDPLVEEALLVAARVFVDGRDAVLVDRDLRAALGGLQHGFAEQVAGFVVAPQERANLDRFLGFANAAEDLLECAISRAEHPQRATIDRRRHRVQRRRQPQWLHLPDPARPPTAKRASTNGAACHLDPLRLTQLEGSVNCRQTHVLRTNAGPHSHRCPWQRDLPAWPSRSRHLHLA